MKRFINNHQQCFNGSVMPKNNKRKDACCTSGRGNVTFASFMCLFLLFVFVKCPPAADDEVDGAFLAAVGQMKRVNDDVQSAVGDLVI